MIWGDLLPDWTWHLRQRKESRRLGVGACATATMEFPLTGVAVHGGQARVSCVDSDKFVRHPRADKRPEVTGRVG